MADHAKALEAAAAALASLRASKKGEDLDDLDSIARAVLTVEARAAVSAYLREAELPERDGDTSTAASDWRVYAERVARQLEAMK